MKFTAEQIKEIRQRTGLSQKLFALAIGITPRAVRNWEQGISEPGSTATRILRAGLDMKRLSMVVSGKRKMKWSEYLSILFVLWDVENGHGIVEENGLFPDALKSAMSINRHAHGEQGGG